MTTRARVGLSELIPELPVSAPQTLVEVWQADLDSLPEPAKELRRHLVEFRNATEQRRLLGPNDLMVELTTGRLRPFAGRWLTVPLDGDRRRLLVPVVSENALETAAANVLRAVAKADPSDPVTAADAAKRIRRAIAAGGSRWVWASHLSVTVPTADTLTVSCPVPADGRYVLVYGGSPAVLDDPAVCDSLEELLTVLPVADVAFWHMTSDRPAALYSLGAGRGACGGTDVEFPNPALVAGLRTRLQKGDTR